MNKSQNSSLAAPQRPYETTDDSTPLETAAYIASLAGELSKMASAQNLPSLEALLRYASQEARQLVRR